jgi:uncharacterized protein YbjQ (UPF0145 family)
VAVGAGWVFAVAAAAAATEPPPRAAHPTATKLADRTTRRTIQRMSPSLLSLESKVTLLPQESNANRQNATGIVGGAMAEPFNAIPMTTALELPGMEVTENLGVCYGLVVRSMGLAGSVASSFKALRRGEVGQYTQLLEDSRRHAIDRMVENAKLVDADAIVAVRFDSSEIGQQLTEIVAYGTAVKVKPQN